MRPAARLTFFLLLAALAGCNSGESPKPPPPTGPRATVTVEVDQRVPTRGSMNGFIHSLGATEPPDDLVAPLAPRLFRSDLIRASVDRAAELGARYQLVLSDLWGYPANGWNGRGPPWADLDGWERFVRGVARDHAGRSMSWDIWNEPNGATFWEGGRERFFRTYAVANRVLREELGPDVEIAGPSVSRWSPLWIEAFLARCLSESCRISALTWHENLRPDDPITEVSDHLRDARSRLMADPRYAPLGLTEIHVNEYVGREDRYLPGAAVAYFAELEDGGADLAALSCWNEADCGPAGLGGLLAAGAPRSAWWAHRWYARGADTRVRSKSGSGGVTALASRPSPGEVEVLLGHVGPRPPSGEASPLSIDVAVKGLPASADAQVTIDRVGASGEAAANPERVDEREMKIRDGRLRVLVPELGAHEAALLSLAF